MRLEFEMSSRGHGVPVVDLLRAVGYQDASLAIRQARMDEACLASVTVKEPGAVDEVRRLVRAVDPEARDQ